MDIAVVLFHLICVGFTVAFNFDTDFPIVYVDPFGVANQALARSTYFGYSVILHHETWEKDAWIQIGAPRANSSAIANNEPGIIFRCKIYGPCRAIDVDTSSSSEGFLGNQWIGDKKDNAWIGGTMDIDERSGRTVVCGHRWINNRKTDYWMEGVCYWSHLNDTTYEKLIPLSELGKAIVVDANSRNNVFYYAQGQAGFSAHMTNLKGASELLLGAPGVYNWDGTTLIYRDSPHLPPIASRLQFARTHQLLKRSAPVEKVVNIANTIATVQTASFGLFGYAVTSGYFFKKTELLYASGGPRSKTCIGQVLVYKFADISDQALLVRDTRQGYQIGEYFGSALVAGDINQDGLDDLIVGAPFYTNSKYNEGRIFVFLGSSKGSLETPQQNAVIEGKEMGGQFGTTLMFLGDLHLDGYADVAVASPYENEGSGAIYIYRGNAQGLDSTPSQRILGKNFVPNIKGFGISMSRPTDVDNNFYDDLAVGAYASGHVVLLRTKPVVILQQAVVSLTPRLDHNARDFQVRACFWYRGTNVPPSISITRKIVVDELLHRAFLPNTIPSTQDIVLTGGKTTCQNITILIKKDITDRYNPITVSVSQELVKTQVQPAVIYVDQGNQKQQNDGFCKTCPVSNTYKSTAEQTVELSFALGCGDDNLCVTKLDLESKFVGIGATNEYVLGSKDYLQLEAIISNSAERAYLTQLVVELPKSVYFRSIPTNCLEQNSSSVIICNVDNPLYENKQKTLTLDLDMKEVNSDRYIDTLNFTLTVLTSSENINSNKFVKILNIVREADIALTGKTSQQSYSYGNITYGKPNFTQIYQVEKIGASPIDEVHLTIQIPIQIHGMKLIKFLYLYTPEGYHAGQPINCQSSENYILEETMDILTQFGPKPTLDDEAGTEASVLSRPVREAELKSEDKSDEGKSEFEFLANRTFYVNCTNPDIECAHIDCTIGPFKAKQNTALLQIKMLFDVQSLAELLDTKDIIILSTDGFVTIKNPPNFVQSGNRSDFAIVSSVFVGEIPEGEIALWIIIVAIIVGLLLLLLLIMGLVKAGFFKRTKRMELEALKEAEVMER